MTERYEPVRLNGLGTWDISHTTRSRNLARTHFVRCGLGERHIGRVGADGCEVLGGYGEHAVVARHPTPVAPEGRRERRTRGLSYALALPLVAFTALRAAQLLRLRACERELLRPDLLVEAELIKSVGRPSTLLVDAMVPVT